ncbi:guanylate kinase [bacterium]|nr:guanylate kinase [bacterium]
MAANSAESPFQIVVLSGPSGSGKTTIVERLIREAPVRLVKSVSATTRSPRVGETPGESYYFLSQEEFQTRLANDEFLETAEVYSGLWYGTLKSEVDRARLLGGWSFLEIDVQGALRVMDLYPEAITIFVKPPSMEVCEQRLRARKTDSDAIIQQRLAKVQHELSFADRYRHQVVNDTLDHAIQEILGILDSYR